MKRRTTKRPMSLLYVPLLDVVGDPQRRLTNAADAVVHTGVRLVHGQEHVGRIIREYLLDLLIDLLAALQVKLASAIGKQSFEALVHIRTHVEFGNRLF